MTLNNKPKKQASPVKKEPMDCYQSISISSLALFVDIFLTTIKTGQIFKNSHLDCLALMAHHKKSLIYYLEEKDTRAIIY